MAKKDVKEDQLSLRFNTRYTQVGVKPQIVCGEGLTEQHHKDRCDINVVLKKYEETGLCLHGNPKEAKYGDFSEVGSYQEALDKVIQAEDAFMSLPAKLRNKFNNSASEFVAFVDEPDNLEACYELGIFEKPAEKVNMAVEPAPQAAEATE